MKEIFLEIQARLLAQVAELKWIDMDMGQLENYGDRPAVLFPCALIDFDNTQFSDMGDHGQLAECTVTIRLGFSVVEGTNSFTKPVTRANAMKIFDAIKKVNAALHGWRGTVFSTVSRRSQKKENRTDPLKVYEIMFLLAYEDFTANTINDDENTFALDFTEGDVPEPVGDPQEPEIP